MSRVFQGLLAAALALGAMPAAAQLGPQLPPALRELPQRPITMRQPISVEASQYADQNRKFAPGGDPLPIYLNRWGGTYYSGYDDSSTDHSSIVNGASAVVGGFNGSDAQWTTVLSCVQDMYSRFNVYVTDVEPLDGDYVEAVVGGSPQDIGMSFGVGGVAPYDPFGCGVMSNAVVYAFADSYGTSAEGLQSLCETVTQEVAHAFTLDHELLCEDPMTYLDGCAAKEFQDVWAPCGEWLDDPARTCTCGETANAETQNSVQRLFTLLGPGEGITPPPVPDDRSPPELAILSPADATTVLANSTLEVVASAKDDIGLVLVSLEWLYSGDGLACPGEGGGWSCVVDGETYTWRIDVTEGLREFKVRARDVMGKLTESETRWVWLGQTLDEVRPNDETPPEITMVAPVPDAYVALADGEVAVTATIYDADTGIAELGLVRSFGGGYFIIPCLEDVDSSDPRAVRCEQVGGTYTWHMGLRRARDYQWGVYAKDYLGNETLTEMRTYHVVDAEVPAPSPNDSHENNDTWDLAEDLACGTALDLKSTLFDADWFTVQAPTGMLVDVKVTGDIADRLRLSAHKAPTIDGYLEHVQAKAGFEVEVPEEGLKIRVESNGAVEGDYRLQVACRPQPLPPVDAPASLLGTCSHVDVEAGPGALFGVLALLGLALGASRRRRA